MVDSLRNRGSHSNPHNRFHTYRTDEVSDDWEKPDPPPARNTTIAPISSSSIISRNQSPDVPFDASINPYQGCEHGCVYCFARPTHEFLDLSPGLDFETRLFYKPDAVRLLEQTLRKKSYRCTPITLGANTDCYQPMERKLEITRDLLNVLDRYNHPCAILTKSTLVLRDLEILEKMAQRDLVRVLVSVTTLDDSLKRSLEPRTAAPLARIRTIQSLTQAGIPTGVLVAPIIPAINDMEIEEIVGECARAGAQSAGYVLLRLPHQLKSLFYDWLKAYAPLRADHVMNLIKSCRGDKAYDSQFGKRMTGTGDYAQMLAQRFKLACRKHTILHGRRGRPPRTDLFRVPESEGGQLRLL